MPLQRLGFAGTPDFAATVLRRLIDAELPVGVVYTQPDRPRGRGRSALPSPVKQVAEQHGIALEQPASLRGDAAAAAMAAQQLDVLIVAAYGLLLPPAILAAPRLGCVNVHASLLPRWRGAAPIEHAMLAGDPETGVAIMQMEKGLDTGPVYSQATTPLTCTTTASELHNRLAELGSALLISTLPELESAAPIPQDDALATLAPKIGPDTARIDFNRDAEHLDRQVRALAHRQAPTLMPIAGTGAPEDLRLRLFEVVPDPEPPSLPAGTIYRPSRKQAGLAMAGGGVLLKAVAVNRGKGSVMPIAAAINGYAELFADGARWQPAS